MRECPRRKTINDDVSKRCDCGLVFDAGVVVPIIRPGSPAEAKAYGPPRGVDVVGRILWALALSVGFAMAWDGTFRRR